MSFLWRPSYRLHTAAVTTARRNPSSACAEWYGREIAIPTFMGVKVERTRSPNRGGATKIYGRLFFFYLTLLATLKNTLIVVSVDVSSSRNQGVRSRWWMVLDDQRGWDGSSTRNWRFACAVCEERVNRKHGASNRCEIRDHLPRDIHLIRGEGVLMSGGRHRYITPTPRPFVEWSWDEFYTKL